MIIADICGYIAIFFTVLSFINKDRKQMLLFNIISTSLYAINVVYYNGLTGGVLSIISVIIMLISIFENKKLNKRLLILAPFLAIISFIVIDEGYIGLFPMFGIFFSTTANLQNNTLNMKYIFLASATSWLIFGIIIGSTPAILLDIVGLIALFVGIYKIKKIKED